MRGDKPAKCKGLGTTSQGAVRVGPAASRPCSVSPLLCLLGLLTAVVGAGIGGSAVAHFLQQHFGPRVQIDVFEKGTVGGRLATISVNKQHYESGAASFHSLSLHMQDFVKQLGECTAPGFPACRIQG